ncbi:DinB family protein [Paenibacillus taihuensis]|uniref:DinB family protein n=1 Tax=Paenibacillus taihuensis TaxID=1156355 RepID=A0A3D9RVP0_9BACL|nr:DinB family protein [Paenibacillus taihuensis]REE83917.1 DinB family protein [Paenibacillus taihuensis]
MQTIKRMIEHQIWADKRMMAGLRANGGKPADAVKLMRHLATAEQVWVTRLNGQSSAHLQLWQDDADLDSLEELLASNEASYRAYADGLTEEKLDEMVSYANQSGVMFSTSVRDILSQVVLHGQYHRGQINRALKEAGGTPQALDYILYARMQ